MLELTFDTYLMNKGSQDSLRRDYREGLVSGLTSKVRSHRILVSIVLVSHHVIPIPVLIEYLVTVVALAFARGADFGAAKGTTTLTMTGATELVTGVLIVESGALSTVTLGAPLAAQY